MVLINVMVKKNEHDLSGGRKPKKQRAERKEV